jgi:hypothetical protein
VHAAAQIERLKGAMRILEAKGTCNASYVDVSLDVVQFEIAGKGTCVHASVHLAQLSAGAVDELYIVVDEVRSKGAVHSFRDQAAAYFLEGDRCRSAANRDVTLGGEHNDRASETVENQIARGALDANVRGWRDTDGERSVTGQRQKVLSRFRGTLVGVAVEYEFDGGLIPTTDGDLSIRLYEFDLLEGLKA